MLDPTQFEELKRACIASLVPAAKEATADYLDKHGDALLDKHLDMAADDAGLATEVTGRDSSLNTFSIACPASTATTLYADLLYWADVVPYGFSSESASYVGASIGPVAGTNVLATVGGTTFASMTAFISPAEFQAAGFGWQPPAWLNAPLGINGQTNLTQGQTYQLSLMYMLQSVAVFSNLNITSSENSQQAPIIGSAQLTAKHVNAWGAQSQNGTPLTDAIEAAQYRQNQIVIDLGCVMTLFDWINITTSNAAGTTPVTFQAIFHAVHKQARGKTFHAQAQAAQKKVGPPPRSPKQRGLALK